MSSLLKNLGIGSQNAKGKLQPLEDTGLTVFGFVNESPERVQAFIGLGTEPAAQHFADTLREAVARANR